jgi:hypothetical protein
LQNQDAQTLKWQQALLEKSLLKFKIASIKEIIKNICRHLFKLPNPTFNTCTLQFSARLVANY